MKSFIQEYAFLFSSEIAQNVSDLTIHNTISPQFQNKA